MRRVLAPLLLTLLAALPAAAAGERPGAPGQSDATFEVSWSRFTRYYDEDGRTRPLEEAFGPGAKDVVVDALLFQFGGRYVFAPGLTGWVDVPLVRPARAGKIESLLGDESFYAASMTVGDVSAGAKLEIPLDLGDVESGFGVAALLKGPTGNAERIDADEMPTGGGDFGVGGELFAVVRPWHSEAGAAAGLLLLLPHRRDDVDVDRGDLRSARAWVALPAGSRAKLGLELFAFQREADRADGEPVRALFLGAHPGVLVPESRMLSLEPYAEIHPGPRMRLVFSAGASMTPWLFVPGDTGVSMSGKNVLVPGAQARISFLAGF